MLALAAYTNGIQLAQTTDMCDYRERDDDGNLVNCNTHEDADYKDYCFEMVAFYEQCVNEDDSANNEGDEEENKDGGEDEEY